jgi:elongation factor Ts
VNENRLRQIKVLRERTGADVLRIREALAAFDGDLARAEAHLAATGRSIKDGGQGAGLIVADTHQGRIGAMLEVRCGTDFVARTDEFRALCKELLLQVIGCGVETPLEQQDYVRHPQCKVADLIDECARKVGEQITVRRAVRWELK